MVAGALSSFTHANGVLTCQRAGLYDIGADLSFASATATANMRLAIFVNGGKTAYEIASEAGSNTVRNRALAVNGAASSPPATPSTCAWPAPRPPAWSSRHPSPICASRRSAARKARPAPWRPDRRAKALPGRRGA